MGLAHKHKETLEGKLFAAISYLSPLCIVTLILRRNDKFAFYHGRHGLVFFAFEVAAFLISIIPVLGGILKLSIVILGLACLWSILQALKGNYNRLPVISNIADKIII